ncbi:MAG: leucine-rich repeat domain-containing protein, partial [Clostridiales bacterium]|nr:leucine-rich repeat domain-containing protein [Clostridiales bacterium]
MKGNKNKINNKYTKIMLLALLVIAIILSMYLVTSTNNKVFNAKIINQKADTREVVNIPDQDLKNFLLEYFKKPDSERRERQEGKYILKLSNIDYVKPDNETEIYKDEMEMITELRADYVPKTVNVYTGIDITGLEKAKNIISLSLKNNMIENIDLLSKLINLRKLNLENNYIMNIEGLRNLTNLTELYLDDNAIENLDPLKGLINLNNLFLNRTKINNIESLRGLINLIELDLGNNKIENIDPLRGLINLKKLKLNYNYEINNIEGLRNLTNLTYLTLENTKVENINVLSGLTNLAYLDLVNNKIEDIDALKGLINLTELYLSGNKIENIESLKGLTNLRNLSLGYNNEINNIESLRGLTNLIGLDLNANKIENIEPLRGLTNLVNLSLQNNKIANIDSLKNLSNINNFNFYSQVIKISPHTNKFNLPIFKKYNGDILNIEEASYGRLKKNEDGTYSLTRKLYGNHVWNLGNGINYLDPKIDGNWDMRDYPMYELNIDTTNIPIEEVNIPNQELKNFLLHYLKKEDDKRKNEKESYYLKLNDEDYVKNELDTEIYKYEMEKITELRAVSINDKENNMDLTGLETAINLTKLYLENNKIKNIESLKGLNKLTELSLQNNNIENVEPLKDLNKLTNLYLSNNEINNIEGLRNLTNLTYLTLENNKVENLEGLNSLTNLEELYLDNNKIENLDPLKGITSLTYLFLNRNKINNIEGLTNLTNLTYLSLDSNKIENIEPIKGLINLTDLSLSNNKIYNIEKLKELTDLTELSLYNEEITIAPTTNKFNLPVLKKYSGEIFDIIKESNGLLKKNEDGTYSFTRKVREVQKIKFGTGIEYKEPTLETNWDNSNPMYILKIDPTNIVEEKISITKTVKDKSNTLFNNRKESKIIPVIKRNGKIINEIPINNVGHRNNTDDLLSYTWNDLLKKDDTDVEYNYEITFDISGLPEGYSIEKNTLDPQIDFNINYVSPKISFTGNVKWVNGENINKPNVTLGLVRNGVRLEDKYNKVVSTQNTNEVNVTWNELDKTDKEGNVYTYTIVEDTVLENYTKSYENGNTVVVNTYVSPKINFEKTVKQNGGKNIPVKVTL